MTDNSRDYMPLEEVMAELDARMAAHAARPVAIRVPINGYRWVRRSLRSLRDVPPWRRLRWRIQRARRGWSTADVWSLHYHLAKVIAGSVEHLRTKGHCHPGDMTEQEWDALLARIVRPLSVDLDRDIEGENFDTMRTRSEQEHAAQVEALHLLADRFHYLWD